MTGSTARLERLEAQRRKLEHQIKNLLAREAKERRKRETRKKIVVGAVMLARAREDESFAIMLRNLLNEHLTSKRDRELFDLPRHHWRERDE